MIRNLFGGASKCRTIDKVDIFGDNSGVALYQLDGNANDTGGNYHGTETTITYGGGVYERGAVFNGSTSFYSTTGLSTVFNSSSFTISAWVNLAVLGSYRGVLANFSLAADGGFLCAINSSNQIVMQVANGSTTLTTTGTSTLAVSTWYHIVVTYDRATTTGKVYKNATLETTNASMGTLGTISKQTVIGKGDPSATAWMMNGSIDQVRIFKRAITATEVATLYAECAPTSIVDDINPFMDGSLKALYQFNGNSNDKTNTYNTLFTGATTYTTGKFGQAGIVAGVASGTANVPFPASTGSCSMSWWGNNTGTRGGAFTFSQDASHYIGVYAGVANSIFYGGTAITTAGTIPYTSTIRHYTMVFNAGKVKVYVDGAWTGVEVTMSAGFTTINTFTDGGSTASMFADQVRIFNKALTPLEVASLYNETTPLEEPMYKLVDPFKDGSGKALYKLDGNTLDESGNYNGTATSVTYGAGSFGRAGVFNGISSGIGLPQEFFTSTSQVSVSMWIKTITNASTANGSDELMFSKRNGVITQWMGVSTTGTLIFGNFLNILTSNTTIANGVWNHIVIVTNTTSMVSYINGILTDTLFCGIQNQSITNGNAIGRFDASGRFFTGSIDQVRIFNKALTAGEVSKLYTGENSVIG